MTRNTIHRVEAATPVLDPDLKARVLEMFDILMADNVKARIQMADGQYVHAQAGEEQVNAQEYFAKTE